jgi:hypothetical protein
LKHIHCWISNDITKSSVYGSVQYKNPIFEKIFLERGLQNSDAQLKINHLLGLFVYKLLFCRLCSGVLQEAREFYEYSIGEL